MFICCAVHVTVRLQSWKYNWWLGFYGLPGWKWLHTASTSLTYPFRLPAVVVADIQSRTSNARWWAVFRVSQLVFIDMVDFKWVLLRSHNWCKLPEIAGCLSMKNMLSCVIYCSIFLSCCMLKYLGFNIDHCAFFIVVFLQLTSSLTSVFIWISSGYLNENGFLNLPRFEKYLTVLAQVSSWVTKLFVVLCYWSCSNLNEDWLDVWFINGSDNSLKSNISFISFS